MTWEVYKGFLIDDVPCQVRGPGHSVRDAEGRVVLFHVGTRSLAKKVVDALLFDFKNPPASPSSKGQTE